MRIAPHPVLRSALDHLLPASGEKAFATSGPRPAKRGEGAAKRRVRGALVAMLLACVSAATVFGADCAAVSTLSCSSTAAASLTSSDCTAFDGSQYHLWQFSGNAGDAVTIEMHSTSFDTYLMLLDPSGVPLAENDDIASGVTDSRITFTLTSGGTWTIVANSLAASQTGDYTISLSCPNVFRRRAVR